MIIKKIKTFFSKINFIGTRKKEKGIFFGFTKHQIDYYSFKEQGFLSLAKRKKLSKKFRAIFLISLLLFFFHTSGVSIDKIISPFGRNNLETLKEGKAGKEVFGFAPYWTFGKLDNVDFDVLTTLAYFGVPVNGDGTLNKDDYGYEVFKSNKATDVFKKAHSYGTRVVLTITQMNNEDIEMFLADKDAQKRTISETVKEVKKRGIDGVNIDFEYIGTPDDRYRDAFSKFVADMKNAMHKKIPESRVTVSVYAASVKDRKLYDVAKISNGSDGVFMMAYDFATSGSDYTMPTSPLYGHKEGKYWYDIATAVDDFLKVMPSRKLILGLPWYGYNYPVKAPGVKVSKDYGYYAYAYNRWGYVYSYYVSRDSAHAQTYALAQDDIKAEKTGWDKYGQVGWKAYKDDSGLWRMIFLDDAKSLSIKYDFAKNKQLGGVGMWALGFDDGKSDMWDLLRQKFGLKFADARIAGKEIY